MSDCIQQDSSEFRLAVGNRKGFSSSMVVGHSGLCRGRLGRLRCVRVSVFPVAAARDGRWDEVDSIWEAIRVTDAGNIRRRMSGGSPGNGTGGNRQRRGSASHLRRIEHERYYSPPIKCFDFDGARNTVTEDCPRIRTLLRPFRPGSTHQNPSANRPENAGLPQHQPRASGELNCHTLPSSAENPRELSKTP